MTAEVMPNREDASARAYLAANPVTFRHDVSHLQDIQAHHWNLLNLALFALSSQAMHG